LKNDVIIGVYLIQVSPFHFLISLFMEAQHCLLNGAGLSIYRGAKCKKGAKWLVFNLEALSSRK